MIINLKNSGDYDTDEAQEQAMREKARLDAVEYLKDCKGSSKIVSIAKAAKVSVRHMAHIIDSSPMTFRRHRLHKNKKTNQLIITLHPHLMEAL